MTLLVRLEDLVVAEFGAGDVVELKRHASLGEADVSAAALGRRFLDALALVQGKKPKAVYVWAASRLVTQMIKATPAVLSGHTSVGTILLQLHLLLPAIVAEQLPGSECPEFWGDLMGGDVVRVGFDGDEEAAWVLEGAVSALAEHFGQDVDITRGFPKPSLKERRLVDVWMVPKNRPVVRGSPVTPGLSSAVVRG